MTFTFTDDPTKDFVIGLLINLLILYLVYLALNKARHQLTALYYKLRHPSLIQATVGFGNKWDVAGSSDNSSVFLLKFLGHKEIRKSDIKGFKRIEDRLALQGLADSSTLDTFTSNVYLVLKDEYEFHLHSGIPVSADRLCGKLSGIGIRSLSQSVEHHY